MIGRAPAFWFLPESFAGRLLSPLGSVTGYLTLRRLRRHSEAVGIPVICVGNPTVGGAGKTPTALMILAHLARRGKRPFALLRGHGGRLAGPLRVDPVVHDARDVGDEALLLAACAPTIVSRDRAAGARQAAGGGATHVIMDDGFQNPSLVKDVSILVIDGAAGVGNGRVLPAGPLRAPLAPQIDAADAVLVIGPGMPGQDIAARAADRGRTVLHGHLVPDADALANLQGRRVLAFAGIGRPEKFAATLSQAGIQVAALRGFADHHPYTPRDIASLLAEADASGLALVTTSKDMVRLKGEAFCPLTDRIAVLPVRMELSEPAALDALLARAEERAGARSARLAAENSTAKL